MNERDLTELLRQLVMDYASVCDHPETCACSMGRAWRFVHGADGELYRMKAEILSRYEVAP